MKNELMLSELQCCELIAVHQWLSNQSLNRIDQVLSLIEMTLQFFFGGTELYFIIY